LPIPGNPAISLRPVAFRLRLTAGLALFFLGFYNRLTLNLLSTLFYEIIIFMGSETMPDILPVGPPSGAMNFIQVEAGAWMGDYVLNLTDIQ
jgi:hypothetical protein